MHLAYRNVNDAFRGLCNLFQMGHPRINKSTSRYGDVMVIQEPAIIEYDCPTERVLFNPERDCNPFFHVYEALWMLAGRNDVASLDVYNSRMKEFSDDGKTLNGAYGYRWRHAAEGYLGQMRGETVDQLQILIDHLKAKPDSRRAVLNMWNVEDDLLKIGHVCSKCQEHPIKGECAIPTKVVNGVQQYIIEKCPNCVPASKDVCCNLEVLFLIREHRRSAQGVGIPDAIDRYLDMTVINRSNDLVWGALGANVVHFSFLQEYMAYAVGCEVGRYYQFSNNLHAYEATWKPDEWFKGNETGAIDPYLSSHFKTVPLMANETGATREKWVRGFDNECAEFVDRYGKPGPVLSMGYDSEFLAQVAQPMMQAFKSYKADEYDLAKRWLTRIMADDWKTAATNWIYKRIDK